jgi:glutamine cyclotransferase
MKNINALLLMLLVTVAACNTAVTESAPAAVNTVIPTPAVLNYAVVKIYPHDTSSYTQGLIWHNNKLYEGTGWYGESKLIVTDLADGKADKKIILPAATFGEGIAILNNKIYQLTWQEHKVYVYNAATLQKEKEFEWPYEGWGITSDGKQLIISTGGSNLYFVNPETFKVERTLGISDNNGYIANLNELEYVDGSIYSNVYTTDFILKINPATGLVEGKIDLSNLLQKTNQPILQNTDVLNGIAYDTIKKSFYITGKRWPALYEIKLN